MKVFHVEEMINNEPSLCTYDELLTRSAELASKEWSCDVANVKVEFDGDDLIVATKRETFKVVDWETKKEIQTFDDLKKASRYCRTLGYIDYGLPTWYSPVAYVADDNGCLVYNPRFKK